MEATLPMLERDGQLADLRAALAEARSGAGRLILVTGEAGVGKTTLIDGLDRAADVRSWIGSCERLFTARPLGPFADIAAVAGGRLAEAMGRSAPAHEIFGILFEELRSCPTLLVIEDIHWADEATLDMIALLARRMSATPSLAIASCRDEIGTDHPVRMVLGELAAAGVRRVRLPALSIGAVRELAEPHDVDPDELFRRTLGNPFFVTEVLAAGGAALPPSVRDAVLTRAANLEPGARRLLEVLAIMTGTIPLDLVQALGKADAAHLGACLASGMLVEATTGVAFRHDLARATIAEAIEPLRRQSLHRAALRELRTRGTDAARLAHHAESAGDLAAVAELAPIAAADAVARGSHREAAAQYRRALQLSVDIDDARRAALLELGAHECYLTDRFDEAIEWLKAAIDLRHAAGDVRGEGVAWCRLSSVQRCGAHREDARASGLRAVALLEHAPAGPELAAAEANLAMLALNSCEVDIGIKAAQRALELAELCGDRAVAAHALNTSGMLRLLTGDEGGRGELEDSLRISLTEGLDEHAGRAYIHLADVAQRHRHWDLIDQHYRPGEQYCREHGLDLWLRYLQSYYARTELDRGRWSEAVAAIPARLDTAGTPLARITGLLVLGLVRARRGDPGQWEVLDEAHRLAAASGELQWIAPVTAARAEASWLAGLDGSTTVPPRAVMEQCVGAGAGWWAGELAWWRRRSGIDEPAPPCAVPWALQLAGDAETAAAAWHELGCPYEEALAWASGRDHDHLRRAFDLLDSLGAGAAADVVARRMRELGVRVVPRGVRSTTRANPAGLTSRELEVLVLVADGLRNSQIADRLVLSKKTVDHHVSSILAKLGVSSRAAAAAEARTFGFLDQR